MILALAAAGAGFWFTGNTPEGFAALPLNMICWIAAGILAVISALCFHTDSARKQKAKAASDRFLGTVREHFPELLPPAGAQGTENLDALLEEETADPAPVLEKYSWDRAADKWLALIRERLAEGIL